MTRAGAVRVLVVGDPYMPATAYAEALACLGDDVIVSTLQIDAASSPPPRTESEHRLREYVGDPAEIARAVAGHHVLIVHGAPVSSEVLDAAPLRLVSCARGGPVNVDVAAATDRGIPVANTPGKNAEAVAELTIAFALLLLRKVPRASRHLLEGGAFTESVFDGREYFGREAAGVTLGLVGLGHVGREVAPRAQALGFKLIASDPWLSEPAGPGVELVKLDDLVERSDIVSVHARATPDNRHMFGREQFARMRPGTLFINTARESLVDEQALRDAMEQGIVAGAALDVVERPQAGTRHPLLNVPNVLLTPHIGGATAETLSRGARVAVAAVADLIAARTPSPLVNPEVLGAGRVVGP
ncbi:MAG TPA: NAD(P)-dependent oxidoreductase [Streptosporangiaceae bacterium]|nr:NAD(P)-dependent oxidoreductase [Streptosporangiaceae bacterium]